MVVSVDCEQLVLNSSAAISTWWRRDTLLGTVRGILAAQLMKPQARVLAHDCGISCVTVEYDMLRGLDNADDRLF